VGRVEESRLGGGKTGSDVEGGGSSQTIEIKPSTLTGKVRLRDIMRRGFVLEGVAKKMCGLLARSTARGERGH